MRKHPLMVIVAVFIVTVLLSFASISYAKNAQADTNKNEPWSIEKADPLDKIDCAQMIKMGIEKQENLRAGRIMVHCGLSPKISRWSPETAEVIESLTKPWAIGGVDVDTITGTTDPYPSVTQGESMVWGNGNTIFATINTSPSATCAGGSYGHGSYSTDGGATFTRLCPNPFATGHTQNYGDPMGVYNVRLGKWYVVFLATGCGGQGMGVWESTDAVTWTTGACAHSGSSDDRESMWVDNNPGSPYYGRMYISWNDFAASQGIYVVRSDDGTTWTSATVYNAATFHRNVQITGSPGTDGTIFVASMDEGGGGSANRTNLMYRSTDGGVTWTLVFTGSAFAPPGSATCPSNSYFYMVVPIWRHMGWGQPAVGPANTVHYVYAGAASPDTGNIYYIRSTDNGITWSTPIQLNTDTTTNAQWMPSLSADSAGHVLASWYDRRNSTDGTNYQRYGRVSNNAGVSWQTDDVISDVISPQPLQPDSSIVDCYAGDYDYASVNGTKALVSWTDGRTLISGNSQQDVEFDSVQLCSTVPNAPTGTTATPSAPNQITVNWNSVSGANCYNVYKSNGACPGSAFVMVSNCQAGTSYVDNTVSGGSTYSYKITSVITPSFCESAFSQCADATATGICILSPVFTGAAAAIDNQTSQCSITVAWNAGTSQCSLYPTLTYTIYKSTDPSFVPGPANQVATCVSGITWNDTNVASGLTFYYVVRAEDSRPGGGTGPCNGGNFETNTQKVNVSPLGPGSVLFSDDFESGIGNWTVSSAWQWVTTQAHSGTHSAWSNNVISQNCDTLTKTAATALPASPAYKFGFWTYFNLESGYDGVIVEGSSNGAAYTKLTLTPNYPGTKNSSSACMPTQPAFTGAGATWTQYSSDLTPYAGSNFQARFNVATDTSVSNGGWWVDDVRIYADIFCQNGNPNCSTPPIFSGLTSAGSPGTSNCQINLAWGGASSTCATGPTVTYHIYKDTNPLFIPASTNRIAQCYTGTTYTDSAVTYGTTYYYIVRSEDTTANGSGPCNNGNTDANLLRKSAAPVGPTTTLFSDNFEVSMANWTISSRWAWSTAQAHGGTHSAWSQDTTMETCVLMTQTTAVALPVGSNPALHFWTYFNTELNYDGGIVQGSSDGTSFTKLALTPDYPGNMTYGQTCYGGGQRAFAGTGTTWTQYNSDLSAFAGVNFTLRFNYATDGSVSYNGWYIDDISIDYGSACSNVNQPAGKVLNNLTVTKSSGNPYLCWSPVTGTCTVTGYEVYRGNLPWTIYNHASLSCSASSCYTDTTAPGSYYYLVVSYNTTSEGSYGTQFPAGTERPQGSSPCRTQSLTVCN